MTIRTTQLLGSTHTKTGLVDFRRCPRCRGTSESLILDAKGRARCHSCDRLSHLSKFALVRLKRSIAVCAGCGSDVPLTPDYAGFVGIGYLCNQCGNYVALRYGNQRIQPDIVLSVRWNSALRTRAKLLDGDLGFATCGSEKDYLTLHALQVLAKAEEPSFAFGNPREYKAALFFRTTDVRYTGYIAWTEETNAILRQIFVVKEQRRKGYAKITLRFWATTYAEPF